MAFVTRVLTALALLALLVAGCGGERGDVTAAASTESPPPGASSLSYSPKPYYKDMSKMQVRFTTTGPAGPGREYSVWLSTGLDKRDKDCVRDFAVYRMVRGARVKKTYVVTLFTVDVEGNSEIELPACLGRARLEVRTEGHFKHVLEPVRVMRKLSLQILPPRR